MNLEERSPKEHVHIGGQAVIEGVMMRGERSFAVAVRKPDREISVKIDKGARWTAANPLLGLVFIRGIVTLAETLVLGMNTLMYSAEQAGDEKEKLSSRELVFSLTLSVLITILLFIALPAFVFSRLRATPLNTITLNLIEGSIRIAIFVGFLFAVSFMADMKRVFEYHGAEHKTINAYDDLKAKDGFSPDGISPDTVKKYSPIHPSCGTSFLLMVLLTSIIVFSFLGRPSFLMRILLKLLLLPVVAGVSYEIIRLARRSPSPLTRALVAPGMWLQKLTTREPDPSQIEVAIAALKAVI